MADWRRQTRGKPGVRGMRISVADVLEYLASGMSMDEVLSDFRLRWLFSGSNVGA